MAFYKDDPARLTRVNWYFTDDSLPPVPATAFASQLYNRWEKTEPKLGEHLVPHPYRTGLTPRGTAKGGSCGTNDQWLNGCLTTDPVPPAQAGGISSVCCNPIPQQAIGGSRSGYLYTQQCSFLSRPIPPVMFASCTANSPYPCAVLPFVVPLYRADPLSIPGLFPVWVSDEFLWFGIEVVLAMCCTVGIPSFQQLILLDAHVYTIYGGGDVFETPADSYVWKNSPHTWTIFCGPHPTNTQFYDVVISQ